MVEYGMFEYHLLIFFHNILVIDFQVSLGNSNEYKQGLVIGTSNYGHIKHDYNRLNHKYKYRAQKDDFRVDTGVLIRL